MSEREERRGLGLTKAAIVMFGVGIIALSGVPGIGTPPGPDGTLSGLCLDHRGYSVPDARIALFDANTLELVEITRADDQGRFAFQAAPASYSAFAEAPAGSGLSSTWALDRPGEDSTVELILRPGREVCVRVVDENGRAIEGAEVRVYEIRREPAVVTRAATDREGRATLLAPPRAHLSVRCEGRPTRFEYEARIPDEGARFTFHLPAGRQVTGSVTGPHGPAEGVIVSAHQTAEPPEWNGYAVTDAEGRFAITASIAETRLEVLDPTGFHLPATRALPASSVETGQIMLERGHRLALHTLDPEGRPLPTRVWIWSPEQHGWSFGRVTDDAGWIELTASERYSIVAEPLQGGYEPLERWDEKFEGNSIELSSRAVSTTDRPYPQGSPKRR